LGRRWLLKKNLLRQVLVITRGRILKLTVDSKRDARLAGKHYSAVGTFLSTNDIKRIDQFNGLTVQAANGRRYPLETDPNVLHRIAAMDTPQFHEVYKTTSPT
jgi:hypothetical protein